MGLCLFQHEDPAIDTRVHIASIPVFRMLHHIEVFLRDIEDLQRNTQGIHRLLGGHTGLSAVCSSAEDRQKVEGLKLDSLLHDNLGCERTVEPAGEECDRLHPNTSFIDPDRKP